MDSWAESDLAWGLADAVAPLLPESERAAVYATIGAGNSFAAISTLLEASVDRSVIVSGHLISELGDWLDGYVNDRGSTRLRRLLDDLTRPPN